MFEAFVRADSSDGNQARMDRSSLTLASVRRATRHAAHPGMEAGPGGGPAGAGDGKEGQ